MFEAINELAGAEVGDVLFTFGWNAELVYCPRCDTDKTADSFSTSGKTCKSERRVDTYCRLCRAAISRVWAAANRPAIRARVRASQIKCVYGVTQEQVFARFEAQGRKCAACGSETSGSKLGWCTEHDHATKKFRGVVCHPCNSTIGFSKESIPRLLACAAYLKRASEGEQCQN